MENTTPDASSPSAPPCPRWRGALLLTLLAWAWLGALSLEPWFVAGPSVILVEFALRLVVWALVFTLCGVAVYRAAAGWQDQRRADRWGAAATIVLASLVAAIAYYTYWRG